MLVVLAMAAALWGIGAAMGMPRAARLPMIGLLLVAVVGLQVILPDGHPLREATGGSAEIWLFLAGAFGVVLAYRLVWRRLKGAAEAKEAADAPAKVPGQFSETELERYARHIVLREIGGPGQQRLAKGRVLVIGAGGLGAPALQYLAAAGVGTIGIIDDDVVENANLQRQVIHLDARIGMPKVFSAQAALEAQNPHITIKPYHRRLSEDIAQDLFDDYDLVLDGTDNFETRYLANRTAVGAGIPLISGALSQWEGQVSVFDPSRGAPCYECVFDTPPQPGIAPSCAEAGVLGPLPGVVGAMMAVETIKLLTDAGAPLRGEMLIYDALWSETRKIAIAPRAGCPTCGGRQVS
ncbi:HesA/MoeB/ThiF family protein [Primorskyibacter sp. S187A]|uniref:HesA/MoeB/ThiF family protein n=1 Tax=Primorskyibacter sp. S187A TaxID=3415130 RepID=UPI003C79B54A